jgi:tetratricopeptide (TPR) repeat protein
MILAEMMLRDQRFADAEQLLERAKGFLDGTGDQGRMSYLYQDYADLARRQGDLKQAAEYASRAVELAEAARKGLKASDKRPWLESIGTYAEALHMEALVQEALGNHEAADRLFHNALKEIGQTTVSETVQMINLSYAEALRARGEFEQAIEYYRNAARPRMGNSDTAG